MLAVEDVAAFRQEIDALDQFLLGPIATQAPDPLGDAEVVAVRAYLILAHAAVEEFVEAAFSRFVETCSTIDSSGRAHAGAYLAVAQLADDILGQVKRADRSPVAILSRLPALYDSKVVKANNGIKRSNLQTLALGAGLDWPHFDDRCTEFLDACQTLGAKRGEVAHVSSFGSSGRTSGMTPETYPADVRQYVRAVLQNLERFLNHLATAAGPPGGTGFRPARRALQWRMKRPRLVWE